MEGKTVLITGGNTGIGKETAVALARQGARVLFTSRDEGRGAAAVADIQERAGRGSVEVVPLDLADLASVRAGADLVLSRVDRLDVLVNNAGVMLLGRRRETADGFERMFGVNHLGHFLLTALLLDRLVASAPARVVTVSSLGYGLAKDGLSWDDLQHRESHHGWTVYGESKLANIYFARHLAGRLQGSGVTSNALHPGFVATELGRTRPEERRPPKQGPRPASRGPDLSALNEPISPEAGAATSIYLASDPAVAEVTGQWFVEEQPAPLTDVATDEAAAARLWEVSEELIASVTTA
jgi:retinol dehydrogenase-13